MALFSLLVFPWATAQRDDLVEGGYATERWTVHAWWTTTESSGPGQQPEQETSMAGPDGDVPLRNVLAASGFTLAVLLAGVALLPPLRRHARRVPVALAGVCIAILLLVAAHEFWSPVAGLVESCGGALAQRADGVVEHRCMTQATAAPWLVSLSVVASLGLLAVGPREQTPLSPLPSVPEMGAEQRNS